MKLENLFFKKKDEVTPSERILPSDVRYAFQYKEAKLNTSEILDLVENGFELEALYLILKGASEDMMLQQNLLQQTVDTVLASEKGEETTHLRSFLRSALSLLGEGTTVEAQKIALISRQGFELWHQLYKDAAEKYAVHESPVYLLAHATFVGLPAFITAFAHAHKQLYILAPHFFENDASTVCGYSIFDGTVSPLPKDFVRPEHAVVIDDAKNTGAAIESARSFWIKDGTTSEPAFVVLLESGQK